MSGQGGGMVGVTNGPTSGTEEHMRRLSLTDVDDEVSGGQNGSGRVTHSEPGEDDDDDDDDDEECIGELSEGMAVAKELRKLVRKCLRVNGEPEVFEVVPKQEEVEDGAAATSSPTPAVGECLQGFPEVNEVKGEAQGAYAIDTRGMPPDKAFQRFVGKQFDADAVDFSSSLSWERKGFERVHGTREKNSESLAERVRRLRSEVPEAVAALKSVDLVPLEARGSFPADLVCQLNSGLAGGLEEATQAMQRYVMAHPELDLHLYGPSESLCGMFDPWRPSDYVPTETVKTQIQGSSERAAEHPSAPPVISFDDVATSQALSWSLYNSKCGRVSDRLSVMEHDLGFYDGQQHEERKPSATNENDSAADQSVVAFSEVTKLFDRVHALASEETLRRLECRVEVVTAELDMLDGRGVPVEELDPNTPEDWQPLKQIAKLHEAVMPCDPSISKLHNVIPELKTAHTEYKDTLDFLQALHRQERQVEHLTDLARSNGECFQKLEKIAASQRTSMSRRFGAFKPTLCTTAAVKSGDNSSQS